MTPVHTWLLLAYAGWCVFCAVIDIFKLSEDQEEIVRTARGAMIALRSVVITLILYWVYR